MVGKGGGPAGRSLRSQGRGQRNLLTEILLYCIGRTISIRLPLRDSFT